MRILHDVYEHDFGLLLTRLFSDRTSMKPDKLQYRLGKLRLAVLSLYDVLVGSHSFQLTDDISWLANSYHRVFKELKQQLPRKESSEEKLYNDFLIIASATVQRMDVVSQDSTSMLNAYTRKAYVAELAENFYEAYKEVGGLKPKSEIISDFLIVASAAVNNLDMVVSNDEKTMLTENAIKAYRLITAVKKKKMPDMILYDKFRRWFV